MAAFSDAAETAIMALLFNATAWANMADNAATSPQTNIAVSLNTGSIGDAGTLATSEVAYTSYARVDVARTSGGWTVTAGSVSPVAAISFPAGTGGSGSVTHFGTGRTGGGSAAVHMHGTVSPTIVCGDGVTPQLTTATALTLA
jgi:hypothetical protein